MGLKLGDRVVVTQTAFPGNADAARWRGVKGTIVGVGAVYPFKFAPDTPIEDEPASWPMHEFELELITE